MLPYAIVGFMGLIAILVSCELFTNAIEWTGEKFGLHHGITGSILAAVGTALPETLIPIIAILFVPGKVGEDIGIGAILGAPFMLSTLAFGLTGLAAIFFHFRKGRPLDLNVNDRVLSSDLLFFIVVFVIAIAFSFLPASVKRPASGVFLVIYGLYIYRTVKQEVPESEEDVLKPLYFHRRATPDLKAVLFQDLVALAGIIVAARFFVKSIEHLATAWSIDPLVFSLFIAPIATELPEKFNSIMWIRRQKDTLALGNISGAMVFQSSVVVFVGVVCTDWILTRQAILSAVVALASTLLVFTHMKIHKRLMPQVLLSGLAFYVLYVVLTLRYNL
jgi:cation:H+ antiporter